MLSTGLISLSISGETPKAVEVFDINVVCETIGFTRGTYRYTSVVVNYTADSVPAISQFEYECDTSNGIKWSHMVLDNANGTVTTPSEANLDSPLKSNCGICLTTFRAEATFNVSTDDNHCGGKSMLLKITH